VDVVVTIPSTRSGRGCGAEPRLCRYDVSALIAAARGEFDLGPALPLVGARDQLFHLPPIDLVQGSRVARQPANDLEPRDGDGFDQRALLVLSPSVTMAAWIRRPDVAFGGRACRCSTTASCPLNDPAKKDDAPFNYAAALVGGP
jgi:hypothetical protein